MIAQILMILFKMEKKIKNVIFYAIIDTLYSNVYDWNETYFDSYKKFSFLIDLKNVDYLM